VLFMVIERFKGGNAAPVRERFVQSGRMLPAGVTYVDSWVESTGALFPADGRATDRVAQPLDRLLERSRRL